MAKKEFFISCENENLHCIEWTPEGETVAVLQIVHGMVEYIDRYDELAGYLMGRGIAVVGHDHPGHGKTAKKESDLGYISEKDGSGLLVRCTERVTDYVKEKYPSVPNFILGHSMGSFVTRRFITCCGPKVSGAIIVGTGTPPAAVLSLGRGLAGLIGKLYGFRHPSKLLTGISFSGYNSRFPAEEGEHAWISSDREVVARYDKDPFCTYTFRAGGFVTLYDTLLFLAGKKDIHKIPKSLPILITAGGDDPVGSYGKGPRSLAKLYRDVGIEDVSLFLYEGQRHEIINEKDRARVHRELCDWIVERIK
ncbi:MAG: alpha/beta hydrolase [Ruminococcaceae bacterium]|nr:alpha/beta hydrolase [Oscillospiraceae bacterium]